MNLKSKKKYWKIIITSIQSISLENQKSQVLSLTQDNSKYLDQEKKLNEAIEEIIKNKKIITDIRFI